SLLEAPARATASNQESSLLQSPFPEECWAVMIAAPNRSATASSSLTEVPAMPVPIHPGAPRANGTGSSSPFHDPSNITELFLGVFRRDVLSFYPGSRIDREPGLAVAGLAPHVSRPNPSFALDFQLDDESPDAARTLRVSLFGTWYR